MTRYTSFGADVGKDERGRFIRLEQAQPERARLETRLADIKAQRLVEERQTRRSPLAGFLRKVFG